MPFDVDALFALKRSNPTRDIAVTMGIDGQNPTEVARKLSVTASKVYHWFAQARNNGAQIPYFGGTSNPLDPKVRIDGETYSALVPIAAKRQIRVDQLAADILASVLKHELVDAVIADA